MSLTKFVAISFVLFVPFVGNASLRSGEANSPRFNIETTDEARHHCKLLSLDDKALEIDDAGTRVKIQRFIELRQTIKSLPPLLTQNVLMLTTGDRIALDPAAGAALKENRLQVWPAKSALPGAHSEGLSVYVPHAVAVFWSLPDGVDDPDRFFFELQEEPRKRDVVFLKSGDRLEGALTGLDGDTGCSLMVGAKKVITPWSRLAGIAWNTERSVRPREKGAYARAVLAGGTRISLASLRFDGKSRQWSGKLLTGAALDFPEQNLLALDQRPDGIVDLADLTPARYEPRAYLGTTWPLMKDRAAVGHPLRLGENTYERGLGTHAACRVAYKLDGKYTRFDALVGIDDRAKKGRAKVALELDGKRIDLNDGKEITQKDAPLAVRQDLRKVRELNLVVDFGSFGDVQAHVNWAKARLIK